MTQDKCVYTVTLADKDAGIQLETVCTETTENNAEFEASITETESLTAIVTVHGDGYEIPVFEQKMNAVSGVSVDDADVSIGNSKFA